MIKVGYYLPPNEEQLNGCDLWRVALPMKMAQRYDIDTEYLEINQFNFRVRDGKPVGTDIRPGDYDLIHVARPLIREFVQFAEFIKDAGIKFTMDFDDDITDIHDDNVAREVFDRGRLEVFKEVMALADGVTVTTPFLKQKFSQYNDNIHVISNYVPEALIRDSIRNDKENVVGWAAGLSSHPNDLQQVGTAVRDFLWKNRDWKFHHVGDGDTNKILKAPTVEFGMQSVINYATLLEQFKIGIAPLEDSDFNRSKSRLKALEMAALGVPYVASPLPSYTAPYEEHGVGEIASTEEEWLEWITRLSTADLYRMNKIKRGLEWAKDNTIDKHWTHWRDFFQETLDN